MKKQKPLDLNRIVESMADDLRKRYDELFRVAKLFGWNFPQLRAAALEAYGKPLAQFSDEEIASFRALIKSKGRHDEEISKL